MLSERTAERVARNQSTFRVANERIERRAEALRDDFDVVPFICECPDRACTSVTRLSLVDYEMVRSRGEWFLVVPDHEVCVVDGVPIAAPVRRYPGFSVMQKIGDARVEAERLDPRQ